MVLSSSKEYGTVPAILLFLGTLLLPVVVMSSDTVVNVTSKSKRCVIIFSTLNVRKEYNILILFIFSSFLFLFQARLKLIPKGQLHPILQVTRQRMPMPF